LKERLGKGEEESKKKNLIQFERWLGNYLSDQHVEVLWDLWGEAWFMFEKENLSVSLYVLTKQRLCWIAISGPFKKSIFLKD
jgi:hypothetical protein